MEDPREFLERLFAHFWGALRAPAQALPVVPKLPHEDARRLLNEATKAITPECLCISGPLIIVSNLHGRLSDLDSILWYFGLNRRFLILGNFVGAGEESIETACFLLILRLMFPDRFFLLRGAQECSYSNRLEPFFYACVKSYSLKTWKLFCEAFHRLPIAAVLEDSVLCTPAGLSPRIAARDALSIAAAEIPETGAAYDLLFSEPNPEIKGWNDSSDKRSFAFGRPEAEKVCRLLGIRSVVFGTKDLPLRLRNIPPAEPGKKAVLAEPGPPVTGPLFGGIKEGQISFWRLFSARSTREGRPCNAFVLVFENGELRPEAVGLAEPVLAEATV
jgi:diadenosine tetraphosphatase ApaH/serine/threonine PP2A family protein phosphatase